MQPLGNNIICEYIKEEKTQSGVYLSNCGKEYMEEEKLKKIVEKVNRAYPEIAKLISETDIDWYGLRSFDEANPPKIIRKRIHPPIKN